MGDDNHRRPPRPHEVEERIHRLLRGEGVKGSRRLIGEKDRGFGYEGAGDGDALGLTAGKLARPLVSMIRHIELLQGVARLGEGAFAPPSGQEQRNRHVVDGRKVGKELTELEDEAKGPQPKIRPLRFVQPRDVGALVLDAPLVRRKHSRHHVKKRRFARARGPRDRKDLSAADVKVDAAQSLGFTERMPHAAHPERERRRVGRLPDHGRTCSRSSLSREAVRSIHRRSASMWKSA